MAEILRYVDTGSDAAGDGTTPATSSGDNTHAYQSLNAWEAAEAADLDTANNTHTVHCNRTNSGGTDGTKTTISGWTTSVTDFITVMQDDFPVDGIYDSTAYQLVQTNNNSTLNISENYVREKIQIVPTVTGAGFGGGIFVTAIDAGGSDIRIDSCIIKGISSGTGGNFGVFVADADATVTVFNTPIYGFISSDNPGDIGFRAILISDGVLNVYNSVMAFSRCGLQRTGGTATAINCAVFDNTVDFDGTVTRHYNATDEGAGEDEGANGVDISATWDTTTFTAPEADPPDFSVQDVDSPVYQTGNGATPKGTFTDDIIDVTRDAVDLNWDIGAFEFVVGAPADNAGIMTTNTGFWGATF